MRRPIESTGNFCIVHNAQVIDDTRLYFWNKTTIEDIIVKKLIKQEVSLTIDEFPKDIDYEFIVKRKGDKNYVETNVPLEFAVNVFLHLIKDYKLDFANLPVILNILASGNVFQEGYHLVRDGNF